MRKISKIALALALLGTSATASALTTYWSTTDYGQNSTYWDSRMGGWALSGPEIQHYVYWGSILDCPIGPNYCLLSRSEQTSFGWTWGWSLSVKLTLVQNFMDVTYMGQYSETRTKTLTDTYTISLKPGQKAQYAEYMPRQFGNVTLWGTRYKTGKTGLYCPVRGPLGTCWSGWKTMWEYQEDPWKAAAIQEGWKNLQADPTRTFWMLKV